MTQSLAQTSRRTLSLSLLLLFFGIQSTLAEDISGFQFRTFAVKNARIVSAPGKVLEPGHLIVRDGRITAIGPAIDIPAGADVIEAEGLMVYPGFIDAGASAFLDDSKPPVLEGRTIDASRYALAGMQEGYYSGLTPDFATAEHLKLAASDVDKYRQAGFVAVHVLPTGRIVSGRGSVINLASLPPREITLQPNTFTTFFMAERVGRDYPHTKMGVMAHLRQTFLDAERHSKQQRLYTNGVDGINRPAADPVLESFAAIRSGSLPTLFQAGTRDDIERALAFAAEHQLRITIWGAENAYRLIDRIQKTDTDLILHVDFGDEPKLDPPKPGDNPYPDLPEPKQVREHAITEWKRRITGLADLNRAGIRFAVSSRDGRNPTDILKSIRQAIANGLDRDAALAALTINAAKILKLEHELGTVEVGRPANFVITTGPFDHEQTKVRYAVIHGNRYEYNKEAKPVETPKPGEPKPLQVAGAWKLEIESAEGPLKADLEMLQADRILSGQFRSAKGDGKLISGTATKDGIEFVVSIGTGESAIQLKFDTIGWTHVPKPTPESVDATAKAAVEVSKPDELRGNLRAPFGSPAKWVGKRGEAQPPSTSGIQLGGIDTTESKSDPAKPSDLPASALNLENVDSPTPIASTSAAAVEQPVEFPEDRYARPIVTGGNVLIQNGTVITATGQTFPATSILVRSGNITAIGPDLKPDAGMTVIDATGRYVMPGIIDTHSHIMISQGINEITASIVCEVRVRDVVDTADVSEYRALAGGVTTARLLHGSANCIGGQDAVVQLKHGSSMQEHLFPTAHSGVKFALGENVKSWSGRFPNSRLGVEATLNRAFLEGLDYRRVWREFERAKQQAGGVADRLLPPRKDLRLEALADILDHQKFIHSHCYRADEILMLLRVAEKHGIRVWSLQHVLEGYKVAPEIVKHGASCSTFADWWAYKMEAFDATPFNASLLHEAGANTVIKSDDWELIRHLYAEAAKTIRYGNMSPDVAIQTITLNSARELGLADRIGSIEVGKQADLAIFSGHPLSAFSRCEQTLIAGEVYFTRDKQPTAMSDQGAARSAKPPALKLPKPEERIARIDLEPAKSPRYAIVGATIHPVDAEDIADGVVIVEDGKLTGIGQSISVPEGLPQLNAKGLHVYPGLIDAGAGVGLVEISLVRATDDLRETGQFQPDLRAGVAVNPDSKLIPVARAGGISMTLCMPSGGGTMTSFERPSGPLIAGQASLVKFAGWTMPEMVVNMEVGLQLHWPRGQNRKSQIEDLTRFVKEARLYDQIRTSENSLVGNTKSDPLNSKVLIDPRYEAMRPYLKGEKPLLVEADTVQQITEALQFAEKEKVKIVLCGATDGWKLADRIKSANIPLIIGPVMRAPNADYDPFDAPYANAGRLWEAGVKFCFRSESASNSRNLPFEAAMAVSYGLPEKEALRAVTLGAAEILGVADRVGSLTTGKWANAIITDGSPLQQSTQIKGILLQGKPHYPESQQTQFYEKYRHRLSH